MTGDLYVVRMVYDLSAFFIYFTIVWEADKNAWIILDPSIIT